MLTAAVAFTAWDVATGGDSIFGALLGKAQATPSSRISGEAQVSGDPGPDM
jgi:hypothetical protein